MENLSSKKIQSLEKDIEQLNSLIELSFISHQYSEISDFLVVLEQYIGKVLPYFSVFFLYSTSNNVLQNVVSNKNSTKINLINDDFLTGLSIFEPKDGLYVFKGNENKINKADFLAKFDIEPENLYGIRVFLKNDSLYSVALIYNCNQDDTEIDKNLEFLSKIFSFVEPILNKFIQNGNTSEKIKNLHRTLDNISVLYSLSQTANFIDDIKRLLKVVLNKALETVNAEKASLMFYDFSDNSLQIKFVCGLADKSLETDINNGLVECTKIKVNEGIAGTVFAQKKSIICNLGKHDPRFVASDVTSFADTLLCVPLISKGEAIGVFNILNKKDGQLFTRADLEFMEALANQAASAIDNSKLYELATKDGLTKLYIYRHFCTLFENEIRRAARYEHTLNFFMMDIDNFKKVNDTYGHLIGDQVLKSVAKTIAESVRKVDITARYGGEEFAVILPETDSDTAKAIANRIRRNVAQIDIVTSENAHIRPSVSIGVAEFPTCADDGTTLIELADIALYQAKTGGKNVVYEYTPFGCQRVDEDFGFKNISVE